MDKRRRAFNYVGITVLILLIGYIVYKLKVMGLIQLNCPVHTLTGFNCPGCGATRMMISLSELDIYQAFRYNPLLVLSFPFYIYMYISCGKSYILYGRVNDKLANYILYYAIILIAFGVIRNIGWFKILSPTKL